MAAESPPHDSERRSDLAVMDANEYKQKRRLERILDAMDNIPDQADRAREQYNVGEIDMHARRITVQDAVQDAVWEAWNLLLDHEQNQHEKAREAMEAYIAKEYPDEDVDPSKLTDEVLEQYWSVTGRWPHSRYFMGHPDHGPLGFIEQARREDKVVWGLRQFYHLQDMWTESWTEQTKPRNGRPRSVNREIRHTVPRRLSWAAALRLKEFLNREHDMEIQFEDMEDGLPNWGFRELEESPEGVEVI